MCLFVLYYRVLPEAPVLMAAHRDEYYARPALAPQVVGGSPRVLCGIDGRAGGTWLGVNEHGLTVAVTNRPKRDLPASPRSRGALCSDLLRLPDAAAASARALAELQSGGYAGANFICLDWQNAHVVCGGDNLRKVTLEPGLHLIGPGDPDDRADARQQLARRMLPEPDGDAERFLTHVAAVLCQPGEAGATAGLVLRLPDRGTVSSTLVALTTDSSRAIYRYSPGPPDEVPYDDYSAVLRELLQRRSQ